MAREVIPKGMDVRKIRDPINRAFAAVPEAVEGVGIVSSSGKHQISLAIDGEELFYIRLDSKTGTSPIKYAWTMMVQDRDTGAWTASPRAGLTTDDSFAVELNNASVTTGNSKRYAARVNPHTGRVTFDQGGSGGGTVDIKSGDTRLMILGTYDDYKDCPGVPPKPPTLKTACGEDTGVLCVPAYAYAVYQRCGYIWQKVGDTRDFGVWANETNGGSTSAFRRFHVPCWGGDRDPLTWLPDPNAECIGVSFEPASAGALTCTCPTCLSSPPPGSCLQVKFRTMPRPVALPANPTGCTDLWMYMDANALWDTDITIPITVIGCTGGGSDDLFDFEWQFIDGPDLECDWGPEEFDPCDPCRHWGRIQASIGVSQGGSGANCGGAGQWTGEFLARELCDLLCDCGNAPLKPVATKVCNNCGTDPNQWHVIVEGSVELVCCPP